MEQWKTIELFDNYEISNNGRVRNKITKKIRKLGTNKKKYKYIDLWKNQKTKTFSIHRLVAQYFCNGYSDKNCIINHKDTNPSNNHYNNLEWCTQQYNIQHALKYGNKNIGEDCSYAILTEKQVIEICKILEKGKFNTNEIAKQYNVGRGLIYNIYAGISWKHITVNYIFKKIYGTIKLTKPNVEKICIIFKESPKINNTQLGKIFGVNRKTISDIRTGKTWTKISGANVEQLPWEKTFIG